MPSTINADNGVVSGSAGLKSAADSSGVLSLQTNGTTAVTVDTSQNVGIGTSSPLSKLEVNGGAANTYLRIVDTRATYPTYIGAEQGATVFGRWGLGESMRIDSSGNVGIGTTSPVVKLQSAGDILIPSTGGYLYNIYYSGSWKYVGNGFGWAQSEQSGAWTWQYAANNTGGAGAAASPTERMRINSSGELLIGTTTSNGKLTSDAGTAGSALVARGGNINAQGGQIAMINTYAGVPGPNKSMRIANNGNWQIINSAYSAAIIEITDAGVAYQGNNSSTWSVISDIRIKTNVRQIGGALDKMMALKPCHFEYKNAIGEVSTGFIAQEFEKVFPGHVKEQSAPMQFEQFIDGNNKTIKTVDANLIPYLVKAIQELKAEVDSLKSQLAAKG